MVGGQLAGERGGTGRFESPFPSLKVPLARRLFNLHAQAASLGVHCAEWTTSPSAERRGLATFGWVCDGGPSQSRGNYSRVRPRPAAGPDVGAAFGVAPVEEDKQRGEG